MLKSDLTDRVPSKEGEDQKRKEKVDKQKDDQTCLRKDSSTSGKSLVMGSPEMEKVSEEPQKNLEVKRKLVVNRLTSEEHRASQGYRKRERN